MLCTWAPMRLNTLLMFSDRRPINVGGPSSDPAAMFAAMAGGLARSVSRQGKRLRIFTDDPERLAGLLGKDALIVDLEQLPVDLRFPKDITFWAAHHKINIFRQFGEEEYPNGFLDLDMVLMEDASSVRRKLEDPAPMQAWIYDISAQVFPAYTRRVVQGDLARVGAVNAFPRWYGGEFMLGVPDFFRRLHEECERLLPNYLEVYRQLNHIGMETVVSVAVDAISHEFTVGDAGAAQLIVRQWASPTRHVQPRAEILDRCSFWHLPDMKWALSRERLCRGPHRIKTLMGLQTSLLSLRALFRSTPTQNRFGMTEPKPAALKP